MITEIMDGHLEPAVKVSAATHALLFTARAYARAVLGVVILSVRLSVCHTRGL